MSPLSKAAFSVLAACAFSTSAFAVGLDCELKREPGAAQSRSAHVMPGFNMRVIAKQDGPSVTMKKQDGEDRVAFSTVWDRSDSEYYAYEGTEIVPAQDGSAPAKREVLFRIRKSPIQGTDEKFEGEVKYDLQGPGKIDRSLVCTWL
jgi:hypothetical protein